MVKNILESGGGGGLGSRVVVLRKQDDAYICNDEWKYLKGSFYNAESLYLSVIEDNSNINVVVLEGKIKDGIVSFMGYYTDEANNNHVFILTEGDVRDTVKVEHSIKPGTSAYIKETLGGEY